MTLGTKWDSASWHSVSWNRFVNTTLPEMIAQWATLRSYKVTMGGTNCTIAFEIEGGSEPIAVSYRDIPAPDDDGVFIIDGQAMVVPALATDESLTEIRSVGEQLGEFIDQRIGAAPDFALQDEATVKAWFPLRELVLLFLGENGGALDAGNWLAVVTHLRRIRIASVTNGGEIVPGLVCPFETPEGPNLGRVVTVANGATLRDGSLVRIDSSAEVAGASVLGPSASLIPFIERDDPARVLMGANMMRQWIRPINGQEPLVRSGCEPESPEARCGFSLLTAYISLGRLTYEDGIVLSQSAANRMQYREPLEIGDKFSNRHGQKGVISRILPDEEMPRLADGTIIECVFSFIGLHTRMNTGQLFEALYGWAVRAGTANPVVAPFASPDRASVNRLAAEACGSEMLQIELADGSPCEKTSVAGYVYWGRTKHLAVAKLCVAGDKEPFQLQGEMEYWALRNSAAFGTILEANGITSEHSENIESVNRLIEAGDRLHLEPYAAKLEVLVEKLRYAGIKVSRSDAGLGFAFAESTDTGPDGALMLPEPVAHPWISLRKIDRIVSNPDSPDWIALRGAADRLRLLLDSGAPESLIRAARTALADRMKSYYSKLICHMDFVPRGRRYFGGRTVIVPGGTIGVGQIGIPEQMCWVLFRPFVVAAVGESNTDDRTAEARDALERIVAERWIYINRAPTLSETAILAFQPVMVVHNAIELHPLLCRWLNADFDGDQVAVYHPLSEEAQADVARRLSVAGHLRRDPDLVRTLTPTMESLWGLAHLSLSDAGRTRIGEALGGLPSMPEGYLTAETLGDHFFGLVQTAGVEPTLTALCAAFDLGLGEAARSGASLNPFMAPPRIAALGGEPAGQTVARHEISELFAASGEFDDEEYGAQLLAVKSGARGKIDNLVRLVDGRLDGLSEAEAFEAATDVRIQFARIHTGLHDVAHAYNEGQWPGGYNLLARAVRGEGDSIGTTIAYAAHFHEVDPLTDGDAMLFAGIMPGDTA